MNSKEISRFIGKNILLRKIGFFLISITTLREWYIQKALNQILAQINKPFDFLDAGSGMGQHAIDVASTFPNARVTGIELDEEQVQDCNFFALKSGLKNFEFVQGDLSNFQQDKMYDVILCASVLEHISDDMGTLTRLNNTLKNNGYVLIYVPSSEQRVLASLERKINAITEKENKKYPHEHVRYYSEEELHEKLNKTGFNVIDSIITYGSFGRLAYDIVTSVQYSSLFKYIFPFYLMLVHPFVMLLMWADYKRNNKDGNGLMIVAQKKN